MYYGAAVPEKCVGNSSYFKKKKSGFLSLSLFLSKSLPRGRIVSPPTPPNIQPVPPLCHNRSMIFLARSVQLVVRPRIDWSADVITHNTLQSVDIPLYHTYTPRLCNIILRHRFHVRGFTIRRIIKLGSSTNTCRVSARG